MACISSAVRVASRLLSPPLIHAPHVRAFSYFDDDGRVLRVQERAREAVFILRKDKELEELLRSERHRLQQVQMAILQIKDHVQAQQVFDMEVKYDRLIYKYMTVPLPEYLKKLE